MYDDTDLRRPNGSTHIVTISRKQDRTSYRTLIPYPKIFIFNTFSVVISVTNFSCAFLVSRHFYPKNCKEWISKSHLRVQYNTV